MSFDGSHTARIARTLAPGRAAAIDPSAEPLLRDGTQYAVTITASQPLAVVERHPRPRAGELGASPAER